MTVDVAPGILQSKVHGEARIITAVEHKPTSAVLHPSLAQASLQASEKSLRWNSYPSFQAPLPGLSYSPILGQISG